MTAQSTPDAHPVVVGVDGSDSALAAVRWAAAEADRRGAPLRLVSAFGWPPEVGLRERYRLQVLQRVHEQLADAVSVAERAAPGLALSSEVVAAAAIAALDEESRRAQLLVLGSRGLGGVAGLLVGSVAMGVSGRAASPVVVVRGDDPLPAGPVVVGVDDSPTSEAAIGFAFEAAAARKMPLVAVHAWAQVVFDPQVAALIDWEGVEADRRSQLSERLAGWTAKYPDVPVTELVVRGGAAPALVEQSATAQLVVVGSRGRGNLAGLLLGSVSHAVLHRSQCPVAVVRPDTAETPAREG